MLSSHPFVTCVVVRCLSHVSSICHLGIIRLCVYSVLVFCDGVRREKRTEKKLKKVKKKKHLLDEKKKSPIACSLVIRCSSLSCSGLAWCCLSICHAFCEN